MDGWSNLSCFWSGQKVHFCLIVMLVDLLEIFCCKMSPLPSLDS